MMVDANATSLTLPNAAGGANARPAFRIRIVSKNWEPAQPKAVRTGCCTANDGGTCETFSEIGVGTSGWIRRAR